MDLPQPEITELSRPYWQALREGRLVFQRCSCGHAWLPARRECPSCLQALPPGGGWTTAAGGGRLISWVVYHTAYHPAFESRLPYHVALVELDEGPRLLTRIVDGHESLQGNEPVDFQVAWEGDLALAVFRRRRPPG